jgi:hypothetical protein
LLLRSLLDLPLDLLVDQWRVLRYMLEGPIIGVNIRASIMLRVLLFSDTLQRSLIVKSKVASVDDVIRICLLGELVQRLQVAWVAVRISYLPMSSEQFYEPRTSATHSTRTGPL